MVSMCRIKAFLRRAELAQEKWSSSLGKRAESIILYPTHPVATYFLNGCSQVLSVRDGQDGRGPCDSGACNLERRDQKKKKKKNWNAVSAMKQTE